MLPFYFKQGKDYKMQETIIIEGYVEHLRFRNEENGYTVFNLEMKQDEITCIGKFPFISEGQYLELTGYEFDNKQYNEIQFQVLAYEEKQVEDMVGMERYLSSGAIKGIGPNLAKKIVKKFKLDTFRIIEEEPERLSEIKGISERIAMSVASQFVEMKEMRDAMMFLGKYNIPNHYAVRIYNTYGEDLYTIIRENPYRLAEEINGIGFRIADEIARNVGIAADSEFRLRSGILYSMTQAGLWGHVYLPEKLLIRKVEQVLMMQPEQETFQSCLTDLIVERRLYAKQVGEETCYYTPSSFFGELSAAKKLLELKEAFDAELPEEQMQEAKQVIASFCKKMDIVLDEKQQQAVLETIGHGVTIITGGPGTGKTTIINAIIHFFESEGLELFLAAPTGRAAKRMKEATGMEAKTIHRLLEINGDPAAESHYKFERNHENPLETDVVIVDEASMVDIYLMQSLLDAIAPGTRLVLVGDVNQLPSVGPGNVLKDMIESEVFETVRLEKIYRQDEKSRIVSNAHRIHDGVMIPPDNKSSDFFLMPRNNADSIIETVKELINVKMPGYVHVEPNEVQVLVPMRKGEVGVEHLNTVLQEARNPASPEKAEHEAGKVIFREGDKVMQIKNNYKLEWVKETSNGHEIDRGMGVFNGDMGVVTHISDYAEEVTVEFDEGHKVQYPYGFLDELELAYAVTVHKSQGSEYPVVIIPLLSGPSILCTRNLLYTAVTRAKKCVVLVGNMQMVAQMIANGNEQERYSSLKEAILEVKGEM